jgi:hypothetical protein
MNITKLKSNETIEPFKPRQPDWKQLYYALALRVLGAKSKLDSGDQIIAGQELDNAASAIAMNERAIEMGNSIVIVKTSPSEVA